MKTVRDITPLETMGDLFNAHRADSPDCPGLMLLMLQHGTVCPACEWAAMEPE